jgi:hypothetical protein
VKEGMMFFRQFQEFNPLSGDVSESPFNCLPAIAERARDLLKTRSLDQILTIANSIDYVITSHFQDLKWTTIEELKNRLLMGADEYGHPEEFETFFEWEEGHRREGGKWRFKEAMADQLDMLTAENSSVVDALKIKIEDWDDEEPEENPNQNPEGKNYELFAVLALVLVADTQNWYFKHKSTSLAGESAIQAMDAVCHAEHLQRKAQFKICLMRYKAEEEKNNQKKRHSELGRIGANKRHKPMRDLEQWTLKQYEGGNWGSLKKSANQAASDLKEKVLTHGRTIEAHLSEANAQRTIAEWIKKYRARLAARPTR